MRWNCRKLGYASILLGSLVLFLYILPSGCWPVGIGMLLILGGIMLLKQS